jgi:hypothetical protein
MISDRDLDRLWAIAEDLRLRDPLGASLIRRFVRYIDRKICVNCATAEARGYARGYRVGYAAGVHEWEPTTERAHA